MTVSATSDSRRNMLLQALYFLYSIVAEALFPLSRAEKELNSFTKEDVCTVLPQVSSYAGLAIPRESADLMRAVFDYSDERVSKLVWGIKYKKSRHSIELASYALLQKLLKLRTENHSPITLIPIPITKGRRRERGFNQCELIVDEILKQFGKLEITGQKNSVSVRKDVLTRVGNSDEQKKKGRADRIETSAGMFEIQQNNLAELNRDDLIVIIDDVITTGSTMKNAIDTLKAAGFSNVRGLAVAH